MSDLSCAATLVVARHGETEYVDRCFSDEGGTLSPTGRAQAARLGESLRERRIALVYASDLARAVQTAEIAAARLGVSVRTRSTLREVYVGALIGRPFDAGVVAQAAGQWCAGRLDHGFPDGECGHDVIARQRAAMEEIADEHRGETVLVIGHQRALGVTLPALVEGLEPGWARQHPLDHTGHRVLRRDADAWVLVD